MSIEKLMETLWKPSQPHFYYFPVLDFMGKVEQMCFSCIHIEMLQSHAASDTSLEGLS